MHGLPVLIHVGLQDQALECVVRDTPPSLRGSDPRLIDGTLDSLREGSVDALDVGTGSTPVRGWSPCEDRNDIEVSVPLGLATQVHAGARGFAELASKRTAGQEDDGLYVRGAVPAKGPLTLQEALELLGLSVGEQERVVVDEVPAVVTPSPRAGIAGEATGATLDLDQVDLVEGDDEEIDLVDTAILGDKLEIRPGTEGLGIGQPLAQIAERFPFPGVLRFRDFHPPSKFHSPAGSDTPQPYERIGKSMRFGNRSCSVGAAARMARAGALAQGTA
jgi:hypothetical protein